MIETPPRPGKHGTVEIRISKRGHWYAMRQQADGTWQYAAQGIDLHLFHAAMETEEQVRQPATCSTPDCLLTVWSREVCGMCLTKQVVERASRIANSWGKKLR